MSAVCHNLGSGDRRYTRSAVFVAGPELIKTFSEELEYLEEKRHEYTNAEKLFELPITMYPELIRLQKDMKGLEAIFSIYTAQKVRIYITVIMPSYSSSSWIWIHTLQGPFLAIFAAVLGERNAK